MITGIGTDIVEIERVGKALKESERFMLRVFTKAEQEYCLASTNSDQRFAGRFAAKEAVAKALGVSLSWLDVEILPDANGRPVVKLANKAVDAAAGSRIQVSISHCELYAVAYAIAEL